MKFSKHCLELKMRSFFFFFLKQNVLLLVFMVTVSCIFNFMFIEMVCWEISLIVRNIELLHISHALAFFSKFSFYFNKFVEHLLCSRWPARPRMR